MADESTTAAPSAPIAATPAATPDGASAPQPAATAPEKVAVTPEAAIAQIESTDDYATLEAQLDAASEITEKAETQPEATAAAAATTPAPAAAAPTDGAPAPSATPAAAAAEPGSVDENETFEAEGGEKFTKNFRLHTTDPARSRYLKLLSKEPGANPIDLALRAGYTLPASAAPAPAAAPATAPAQTIDEVLKPQTDEIAALQAQKKAHREAYEFDKADEIGEQILDKRLAVERRRSELEQEASFAEEFNVGYGAAKTAAFQQYPDMTKPGTAQHGAIMRERAFLEETEPGFFDNPAYPLELIKRLEDSRPDLFKKPGAAPAPTPAPAAAPAATVTPPPNAAPLQPARPVGAIVTGSETTTTPLTKQAAIDKIDTLTPEQLTELADMVGTKAPEKARRR